MEKNKKILLGGVIAVIVVGVIGAYCYIGKNSFAIPDPSIVQSNEVTTEDWSTCRNKKYGYEFKYPKGWRLHGVSASDSLTIDPKYCETSEKFQIVLNIPEGAYLSGQQVEPVFNIGVEDSVELTSGGYEGIHSIHEYYSRANKISLSNLPIIRETVVDGEDAIWVPGGVQFLHKGRVFHVNFIGLSDERMQNAVMSAFRFIGS